MSDIKTLAKQYFEAFHAGRLEEVLGYFSEDGVVKYGTEPEVPATAFFPETKEMISQIKFETKGVYTSDETNSVIIHFGFSMPSEEGGGMILIEAIDIIEFDANRKIQRVTVIPNAQS